MSVALYLLALGMVAGGVASAYFGSDIIVLERGWSMVISGAVAASAGAVLAGIAAAVGRLKRIEREFARLGDRLARAELPAPPPLAGVAESAAEIKDLEIAPEPVLAGRHAADRLRADGARAQPHEAALVAADGGLPAMAEPPAPPAPSMPAPPVEEPARPGADQVVGKYESGGNAYTMYADGSIEADTPAGRFRFRSLDELKEFIANGGDRARATTPA
jgi:hypothetical protein